MALAHSQSKIKSPPSALRAPSPASGRRERKQQGRGKGKTKAKAKATAKARARAGAGAKTTATATIRARTRTENRTKATANKSCSRTHPHHDAQRAKQKIRRATAPFSKGGAPTGAGNWKAKGQGPKILPCKTLGLFLPSGQKKRRSRPISRVLSWTVIPLGATSP